MHTVLSDFLHFRSGVTDIFVLLGYDASSMGNLVSDISTLEDETTTSSRRVRTNVTQRLVPGGRRPYASVKLRVHLEPIRSGT